MSESRSFCCVTSALLKNRLLERAAGLAEGQDTLRSGRQPAACGCQLGIPDGQRGHPGTPRQVRGGSDEGVRSRFERALIN